MNLLMNKKPYIYGGNEAYILLTHILVFFYTLKDYTCMHTYNPLWALEGLQKLLNLDSRAILL